VSPKRSAGFWSGGFQSVSSKGFASKIVRSGVETGYCLLVPLESS